MVVIQEISKIADVEVRLRSIPAPSSRFKHFVLGLHHETKRLPPPAVEVVDISE